MSQTTGGDRIPWPFSDIPVLVRDLIGRKVRVVKPGEVVTQEYIPGRVTIHVTDAGRIGDIQIEPGSDIK